jgi:hypothetical protein
MSQISAMSGALLTSQPTTALVKPAPLRLSPEAGEGGTPLKSRAQCRTVPVEPLGTLLVVSDQSK